MIITITVPCTLRWFWVCRKGMPLRYAYAYDSGNADEYGDESR